MKTHYIYFRAKGSKAAPLFLAAAFVKDKEGALGTVLGTLDSDSHPTDVEFFVVCDAQTIEQAVAESEAIEKSRFAWVKRHFSIMSPAMEGSL